MDITTRIAQELNVKPQQVKAAVELLDGGATVPFIARYRKEVTGGLDDDQLRKLEERLGYLRELDERRETILKTIKEQGKLTPELERAIREADTKTALEDLYLPFKPKRHTKAQKAREAGLEPLADGLLKDPRQDPAREAAKYVNPEKGVADGDAALEGARQILMERFGENAGLLAGLREHVWKRGMLASKVSKGKEQDGAKFKDYFDYSEPVRAIPSHRALALFRGQNEGVLTVKLRMDEEDDRGLNACEARIARQFGIASSGRPADEWLLETVRLAWKGKLLGRIESDQRSRLREAAEAEAIQVFSRNLKDLLLAAPAGPRATIGLDPGLRTGVKVVVVDGTGKLLETATIYPHPPRGQWAESKRTLADLARKHRAELVSIGNGTASRETERLAAELIKDEPELGLTKLVVSEAGASVYSASKLAAGEFPDLDVSLRGAVSIARRLQDPLAELVKIEPKSIGVGQYQHDVNQPALARSLEAVVEDCVNAVGVNVNTASEPLLARVSGLNQTLARNIVTYRNENGLFRDRMQLKKVPRLGAKAFEQAAGFLRIMSGGNPLDASAVHPEAYPVVRRILKTSGRPIKGLIGDTAFLNTLDARSFVDDQFGLPTITDIIAELEKPGRDPRPEFRTAVFKEGVEELADLEEGMKLEGTVTNVTNFGAFVDVGVHQDGLVHISQLADRFVKDPRDVVKAGDIVTVTVMSVDLDRRRIALSMKSKPEAQHRRDKPPAGPSRPQKEEPKKKPRPKPEKDSGGGPQSAFGKALEKALKK